jgi:hypothetical protein
MFVRQSLEVSSRTHNLPSCFLEGADGLLQKLLADRTSAIVDLSTIYMEPVPHDSSLAEIVPVTMVKPSAVSENVVGIDGEIIELRPFFSQLQSKRAMEANRVFVNTVAAIFVATENTANRSTDFARNTLSASGLPDSIETEKKGLALIVFKHIHSLFFKLYTQDILHC